MCMSYTGFGADLSLEMLKACVDSQKFNFAQLADGG